MTKACPVFGFQLQRTVITVGKSDLFVGRLSETDPRKTHTQSSFIDFGRKCGESLKGGRRAYQRPLRRVFDS